MHTIILSKLTWMQLLEINTSKYTLQVISQVFLTFYPISAQRSSQTFHSSLSPISNCVILDQKVHKIHPKQPASINGDISHATWPLPVPAAAHPTQDDDDDDDAICVCNVYLNFNENENHHQSFTYCLRGRSIEILWNGHFQPLHLDPRGQNRDRPGSSRSLAWPVPAARWHLSIWRMKLIKLVCPAAEWRKGMPQDARLVAEGITGKGY